MDTKGFPTRIHVHQLFYNWRRETSNQVTYFQSSTLPWWSRRAQLGRISFPPCNQQRYMKESLSVRTYIDDGSFNSLHCFPFWCLSSEIYQSIVHILHLMILFSCRWSRFSTFGGEYRCQKSDVLPDIWFSRYTRKIVVQENPNFIPIYEILYPVSRVFQVTWILIVCHYISKKQSSSFTKHLCFYVIAADYITYAERLHTSVICIWRVVLLSLAFRALRTLPPVAFPTEISVMLFLNNIFNSEFT